MSDFIPIMLRIAGKACLVVGAGEIALKRAQSLHDAAASLTVVSPHFTEGFDTLDKVHRIQRPFQEQDVYGMTLVIAATDDAAVNRSVGAACTKRSTLFNLADAPEESQFRMPAVFERGDLSVAISTGGASPAYAARLCDEMKSLLPHEVEVFLEFLRKAREAGRHSIQDIHQRKRLANFLASAAGYAQFQALAADERDSWLATLLTEGTLSDA
jgi:siroheme synthase-like protein